jgi:hypothetical protein
MQEFGIPKAEEDVGNTLMTARGIRESFITSLALHGKLSDRRRKLRKRSSSASMGLSWGALWKFAMHT